MINIGQLVTIKCDDYPEVNGIVGIVMDVIINNNNDISNGQETLYKVNFFNNMSKVRSNTPIWWTERDLITIE